MSKQSAHRPNEDVVAPAFPELERIKRKFWLAGLTGKPEQGRGPENRREKRIELVMRGACMLPGRLELEPIVVQNISLRGIQFKMKVPVAVDDRIRIIVCMPGAAPCQMEMLVRWVGVAQTRGVLLYRVGAALLERLSPA